MVAASVARTVVSWPSSLEAVFSTPASTVPSRMLVVLEPETPTDPASEPATPAERMVPSWRASTSTLSLTSSTLPVSRALRLPLMVLTVTPAPTAALPEAFAAPARASISVAPSFAVTDRLPAVTSASSACAVSVRSTVLTASEPPMAAEPAAPPATAAETRRVVPFS